MTMPQQPPLPGYVQRKGRNPIAGRSDVDSAKRSTQRSKEFEAQRQRNLDAGKKEKV